MSAFGGKADIGWRTLQCPLLTHLRHWLCSAPMVFNVTTDTLSFPRERSLRTVEAMLNNAKIIAFVATTNAAKSRAFYEGVLGLALTLEDEFTIVLDANGVEIRIQT